MIKLNDIDKSCLNINEVCKPMREKDRRIKYFIELLEKEGFIVQEGSIKYIDRLTFVFRSYLALVENKPEKDYRDTVTAGNHCTGYYHFIGASMGDQINNYSIWTDNTF